MYRILKKLEDRYKNGYSSTLLSVELIILIVITLTAIPVFFNIVFTDYDTYTSKKSLPVTAVYDTYQFKKDMLANDVTTFREGLLGITKGFSQVLNKLDQDSYLKVQGNLQFSLPGNIGVLLLNKETGQWFSNRNWFLDYPYNQLEPKEALIKLSNEDDVILFSSDEISHYSPKLGYYNGAYNPPVDQIEEIYFIRGDVYEGYINTIKFDLFICIPIILLFIAIIIKQFVIISLIGLRSYLSAYNDLLLIRTVRAIKILIKNFNNIMKNMLLNRTVLLILLFWCLYLITGIIINPLFGYEYYDSYFSNSYMLVISFLLILSSYIVTLLENLNNKHKLERYLEKVENNDIGIDINTSRLGSMSKLGFLINNLKASYYNNIELGIKNERMKTELITNVSHDLKTPLTSIINYVDLLKDPNLTEDEFKEYLTILDNKSTRLKKLVEDLFEMSKMSSGEIPLNKTELNLVELIHQNLGEISFLGEEKHLSFKVSGDSTCIINLDGDKISRLMDNLICNAIKYSLEGSRIFVNITSDTNNAIIQVKNTSKYELNFDENEILERFVRGDRSRNSNTEGSGLGLAISKSIVELHKGTLKVVCDGDLFKVIVTLPKN